MRQAYVFVDRQEAGRALATVLKGYEGRPGLLVLGLPLGGVPVAYEIAQALGAPLDVFSVRRLELAGPDPVTLGALATGGALVVDERVITQHAVTPSTLDEARLRAEVELVRLEESFRGDRPPVEVTGSTVILVDDGMVTGATMRTAVKALRARHPLEIVVAVPLTSEAARTALASDADRTICLATPAPFGDLDGWFREFAAVEEEEVRRLLAASVSQLPERAITGAMED